MRSEPLTLPLLGQGHYPEADASPPGWSERLEDRLGCLLESLGQRRRLAAALAAIRAHAGALRALDEAGLRAAAAALRVRLPGEGLDSPRLPEALALGAELARRALGRDCGEAELGAAWLLARGRVPAMPPGAAAPLAAGVCAFTAACAGLPVHVLLASELLAELRWRELEPMLALGGLRSGLVAAATPPAERARVHACEVVFSTPREIVFDHLRDRMLLGGTAGSLALTLERAFHPAPRAERLLLPGLCFALAEDADGVFLDQAATALAVTGGDSVPRLRLFRRVFETVRRFNEGREYGPRPERDGVMLLPRGRAAARDLARFAEESLADRRHLERWLEEAVGARMLERGRDYEVQEGRVVPAGEGPELPEAARVWVELKEGLPPASLKPPLIRVSLQSVFRRYLRLAGVSGGDDAAELWASQRLRTFALPGAGDGEPRHPGYRVFEGPEEKWAAIARCAQQALAEGRPVLVGAERPQQAEAARERLAAAGLESRILLGEDAAADDATLRQCLAGPGLVVVTAAALAGLAPPEAAGARAGLSVILAQAAENPRQERRCLALARAAGGRAQGFAALDDELFAVYLGPVTRALAAAALRQGGGIQERLLSLVTHLAQRRAARARRRALLELARQEEQVRLLLAFAGRGH